MRSIARFADARNTTEGKFVSVLLSLLLVFSFLNVTMFTDLANADEEEALAQSEELQEAAEEAGDKKASEDVPEVTESEFEDPMGSEVEKPESEEEPAKIEGAPSGDGTGDSEAAEDAESSESATEEKGAAAVAEEEAAEDAVIKDSPTDEDTASVPKRKAAVKADRSSKGYQDVYCYGLRPGGDPGSANHNANWLGLAKIKVETEPSTDFRNGEHREIYIDYPTDLPKVTLNEKSYQYAPPGSEHEKTAGYYTVKWNNFIAICDGANAGFNNYFTPVDGNVTKNNTYHLDGIISLNDESMFSVGFKVKYPQQADFSLLESTYNLAEEGTSYVDLVKPQAKEVPPIKHDEGGIQYHFDGWYTDEQCTEKVDEDTFKVAGETFFYGRYVKSEAEYTVKHVREGVDGQPESVETDEKRGFVGADTAAVAKEYEGFSAGAVAQKKITEDGKTVVEIRYLRVRNEVTYRFTGNIPANQNAPEVSSHKYGETVSVVDTPEVDGYIFEGWTAPSSVTVQNGTFVMPADSVEFVGNWKRDIEEFSIAPYEGVYDGQAHVPSFTGKLVEGEELEYAVQDSSLTPSSGEPEWKSAEQLSLVHVADSAKSVFVRVVNAAGGVVWQSPAGVAVTIQPRPVTMVLSHQEKTYDGNTRLITPKGCTFMQEGSSDADSGVLETEGITARLNTEGIAAVTYARPAVHADEKLQVSGNPNGEVASEMVTTTPADNTWLDDYAISFKVGNGTIIPSTEIESALNVEFASDSKKYDGTPLAIKHAVVSPVAEAVSIQYGLRDDSTGEVDTWVNDPSDLNLVDAGTYTVVAKVASPNYTGEKMVSAQFTIEKRALKFVGESKSGLAYNGDEQALTGMTVEGDGYVLGHYATIKYIVSGTEAGEYTGSFTPAAAANVKVYQGTSKDVTRNYTIELAPGTMVIEKAEGNRVFGVNFAGVQGKRLVYDGQGHSVVASAQQAGSTIEYTLTPEVETSWQTMPLSFEDAGQYLVYARAKNPNYETTDPVAALLTIEKRPVTITGKSLPAKVYDGIETVETGYEVEATSEGRGLVKHAHIDGVRYELKGTNAGTHDGSFAKSFIVIRTATGEVLNDNYRVELKPGSFEIARRPYTVTTGSAARSYNGLPLTSAEWDVENLVDGETVDVRTTGSITEVGTVDNTYELAWTGTAQEANYQLERETLGQLEVVEADYAVEVRGYIGPYDGAEHGVTVSAPADAEVSFSTDNVYRDVTDGAVEVEYTVTRPNYRIITGTALVQITPRPVTITVDDASKFAGAADPALTGSVEGLVAGDSLGVSYVRANTAETAGIYRGALTAQYVENPNYAVTVVPGTFIILPAVPVPGEPGAVTPDPVPTPDPAPSPTTPTMPTPAPAPVVPTPTVPTPTVPTPTPAAAAPTPAAATPTVVTPAPAATPVATTPVNAPEVIEDDATPQAAAPGERTPLAETEEIADEGNPLGAFDEPHCWVHWVMLLGIVVTALYAVIVVRRRLSLTSDIDDYENQILGRVDAADGETARVIGQQAL